MPRHHSAPPVSALTNPERHRPPRRLPRRPPLLLQPYPQPQRARPRTGRRRTLSPARHPPCGSRRLTSTSHSPPSSIASTASIAIDGRSHRRPNRIIAKVSRPEVATKWFSPPPPKMLAELVAAGQHHQDHRPTSPHKSPWPRTSPPKPIPPATPTTAPPSPSSPPCSPSATDCSNNSTTPCHSASDSVAVSEPPPPPRLLSPWALPTSSPAPSTRPASSPAAATKSANCSRKPSKPTSSWPPRRTCSKWASNSRSSSAAPCFPCAPPNSSNSIAHTPALTKSPHPNASPSKKRSSATHSTTSGTRPATSSSSSTPPMSNAPTRDPKHKMALVFRWYLGLSSRWANAGDAVAAGRLPDLVRTRHGGFQ